MPFAAQEWMGAAGVKCDNAGPEAERAATGLLRIHGAAPLGGVNAFRLRGKPDTIRPEDVVTAAALRLTLASGTTI